MQMIIITHSIERLFNYKVIECSGGACMEARVGTCLTRNFTPSQV